MAYCTIGSWRIRSASTRVPLEQFSCLVFLNQSNVHIKKVMQPRRAANRLFNAWLSAKLCICLTAKFHLPLSVLQWDSLCSADLPCPMLSFSWMSLQPPWAPLPAPCPTSCSRNSVPGWAAPVSTPGSYASHSSLSPNFSQFSPGLHCSSAEASSWLSAFPSLLNLSTLKIAWDGGTAGGLEPTQSCTRLKVLLGLANSP